MTDSRNHNFSEADIELARILNLNPNNPLSVEITQTYGSISKDTVSDYRDDNNLTWHEKQNRKTMIMMDSDVNLAYKHVGGVSESKKGLAGEDYHGTCQK